MPACACAGQASSEIADHVEKIGSVQSMVESLAAGDGAAA